MFLIKFCSLRPNFITVTQVALLCFFGVMGVLLNRVLNGIGLLHIVGLTKAYVEVLHILSQEIGNYVAEMNE